MAAMNTNRHHDARHDDRLTRWAHENDLVRPYHSIPLTTQTTGTTFVRRVSPTHLAIVSSAGTRLVEWSL
jgi:hypothetical protein